MVTNEKEIYTPIEAVGQHCKIVSSGMSTYYPDPQTVLLSLLTESAKQRFPEELKGKTDFDVLLSRLTEDDIDWDRFISSSKFTMKPLKGELGKWIRRHNVELQHITEEEGRKVFELLSKELGVTVELGSIKRYKSNYTLTSKPVDLSLLGVFGYIMEEVTVKLFTSVCPVDRDCPKQGFGVDWHYKHSGGGSNGYPLWSKNGAVRVELDLITREWSITAGRR